MQPIRPIRIKRQIKIGSRAKRIRIGQPDYRPFALAGRDALRRDMINEHVSDALIVHRRGIYRPKIGEDPLEARAVQNIKGTLPERIMYRNLLSFRLSPDIDFSFQSAMEGGRSELGGMVADFILWQRKTVIRVQGAFHSGLQLAKDAEQKMALEEMGYWVVDITDQQVYDHQFLIEWTRRLLGYGKWGGGECDVETGQTAGWEEDNRILELLAQRIPRILAKIEALTP